MEKIKKTPDSSDAEEWIDPDVFKYDGKLWGITASFKVVEVEELRE